MNYCHIVCTVDSRPLGQIIGRPSCWTGPVARKGQDSGSSTHMAGDSRIQQILLRPGYQMFSGSTDSPRTLDWGWREHDDSRIIHVGCWWLHRMIHDAWCRVIFRGTWNINLFTCLDLIYFCTSRRFGLDSMISSGLPVSSSWAQAQFPYRV